MNIDDVDVKGGRFQIMFMSMGEPLLNVGNVIGAIETLNEAYPNAELLISTMAPRDKVGFMGLLSVSERIKKVGLQFSIHEAFDEKRDMLIPFKNKMSIREIRDIGIEWSSRTKRPVFINYCISENNHSDAEMNRPRNLFNPSNFNITFSVICSSDENMKDKGYKEIDKINTTSPHLLSTVVTM